MIGKLAALLTITACSTLFGAPTGAEPPEPRDDGAFLYRAHCASCHGKTGKGKGARPPNLRLISARNDGRFPVGTMYDVIDGRRASAGHGGKGMPVWGRAFQPTAAGPAQEAEVRAKIVALIGYLESLQEPADERARESRSR